MDPFFRDKYLFLKFLTSIDITDTNYMQYNITDVYNTNDTELTFKSTSSKSYKN